MFYDLLGAGASAILDINPDMYDIDINKTKLQQRTNGPTVQMLTARSLHTIMFCLANTLREKSLRRLHLMNAFLTALRRPSSFANALSRSLSPRQRSFRCILLPTRA